VQAKRQRRWILFIVWSVIAVFVLIILPLVITPLPGLKAMWQGHAN
jgi:hypothetical protein